MPSQPERVLDHLPMLGQRINDDDWGHLIPLCFFCLFVRFHGGLTEAVYDLGRRLNICAWAFWSTCLPVGLVVTATSWSIRCSRRSICSFDHTTGGAVLPKSWLPY